MMKYKEMKAKLEKELSASRFAHTMGVVGTAKQLAKVWETDPKITKKAALLHDCAKGMPHEERVAYCTSHGVSVTQAEEENLTLLHAKCGAIMAHEDYGVDDWNILHAIAVHTTGSVHMNTLDKIIFVSDYIEPGRDKAPRLDDLRRLAEMDLDLTVFYILQDTLEFLNGRKAAVDPTTRAAYEAAAVRAEQEIEKSDIVTSPDRILFL